jgi:hypothetical protein
MRLWRLMLMISGIGCIMSGAFKNYFFLRSVSRTGVMHGRTEMGLETIYESRLFLLGLISIFFVLMSRDKRQKLLMPTWIVILLYLFLLIGCAYMLLRVMPT